MSYANGTTHYNLPLTTGSDKRDWADTNQAFTDVDAALHGAVQDTAQAELDIDALETRMDTAEQNIATNTGNISGLDTRLTTAEGAITSMSGQITDTRQDLEDMICAYNEASATSTHDYAIGDYFIYNDVLYKVTQAIAIGDTIVPDTNCETTNVTTELLDIKDDLPDLSEYLKVNPFTSLIEGTTTASHAYGITDTVYVDGEFRVIKNAINVNEQINNGNSTKVDLNSTGALIADFDMSTYTTFGDMISAMVPILNAIPENRLDSVILIIDDNIYRLSRGIKNNWYGFSTNYFGWNSSTLTCFNIIIQINRTGTTYEAQSFYQRGTSVNVENPAAYPATSNGKIVYKLA